jgi:H+/Cl- antiporter ClcA
VAAGAAARAASPHRARSLPQRPLQSNSCSAQSGQYEIASGGSSAVRYSLHRSVGTSHELFGRVKQTIVRATIGGVAFGLVGVVLPLTMFTRSEQLKSVLSNAATLGAAVLVALVIGKIVTFAVCQASGFVGGPIFPALFMGGTAGVAVLELFNSVPLGLAFTCLFAAVPGAVVSAPFSMVLIAAFMTQVGALQTAPILIAVVTAYLAMQGVKYIVVGRKQETAAKAAADPVPES